MAKQIVIGCNDGRLHQVHTVMAKAIGMTIPTDCLPRGYPSSLSAALTVSLINLLLCYTQVARSSPSAAERESNGRV